MITRPLTKKEITKELVRMLKYMIRSTPVHMLADTLGVSKSAIYYYLKGERNCCNMQIYSAVLEEYYRRKSKEKFRILLRRKDIDNLKLLSKAEL